MMAEAGVLEMFSEQELTCSICLDLFNDPVSTPCGHNFCQGCIGGYWASSTTCTCPLCKHQFPERPQLNINRVFAHIAEKYKEAHYGTGKPHMSDVNTPGAMANSNPFLEEMIKCDVCTGKKQVAISSCLTCTASYCEAHVQPHLNTPFYANHQLLEPREALRGRTCPLHHRLLEVYCRTDQICICAICVLEEHRTHRTVSVQTERVNKQKLIGKTELEIQNRIEGKHFRLNELKSRLETVRNYARGEMSEVEQLLGELSRSVDRIREELVGGMEEKRASVETRGEGLVTRLEAELGQLKVRRSRLEAQATSEDHIGFLQSFEEASAPIQADSDTQELDAEAEVSLHFSLGEVKVALGELKKSMDEIRMGEVQSRSSLTSLRESDSMMSIQTLRTTKSQWSLRDLKKIKSGSGLKKIQSYLEDVTLNPVTAYPFLILSDDRKQVKRGEKLQFYRNSTQRFDVWSCVLAKEGFNSGRHYWEVNVGENKDWKVGVVRESAQRKGLFDMSPNSGYYALWWGGTHLRALTIPALTKVKTSVRLRRVGVYLDCEEGQVTFYNVKTGSEVYSFSVAEFSERMFPLLGTGDREVPLALMITQCSSVPE
ncbi:E3 ubiquitin/ISG15 ligase TRIM25 [Oncorhynchus mykiss]|uniref:E3 ubiquitin/ISG15 ligase TRIM25 n=1 Tax=Oncorhynchus mykiss TaxID=8022 RepID=UPI000B4F7550|nr:E3 ubiquitin/ISG15 ligase TRIM25 [Oncorhynchus mykiss]XP_021480401.1 E3 ubiquitin/ISG15 ligase TRIM25 [Oncorhynchus mykiss]XP_021480402.1 E3 ubiquitin/ISG15 ligase TRIM25 [Oncorhynchus mykiss]XP_021480403.1 E3 ubiquitin/ISG15 ligase TRIM25 [Oncorhynchus mykiss]XP_036794052.1 E3 ubiquitin/ISG15 ligase TRIM25 [Oncorhynchus mykiss]